MHAYVDILPWLIGMAVLIGCSAFFSASEACLFYLGPRERRRLASGGPAQRVAAALLADPERLLSAILFWNLVINITYFSMVSIVGLQLERNPQVGEAGAIPFTITALLLIILLSEMVPKSLGVVTASTLARLVALPLAATVRMVDPLMPLLQLINLLSRRLVWPQFQPEPYLEVSDLERAITLSTSDAHLVEREQAVLRNIVSLSEIRAEEAMRPRTQFLSFSPPVSLADLEGRVPPSGYLLITEPDNDNVAAAINLLNLSFVPHKHVEHHAVPVLYVPWFAPVSDVLQQMRSRDRDVAAVVNELGETIGILPFEDLLDTIFSDSATRSSRLLNQEAIQQVGPGAWHVTGMTTLRRLSRHFDISLPESRGVTVAGVTQEVLERLPETGDRFRWGQFEFHVIDAPESGQLTVELTRIVGQEDKP